MACCCKSGKSEKASTICLGRCDLPKHRCLEREEVKPGPVPKNMGWLYTARDAPEHQLRCGWRPGHISCPVLRKIELHNCSKTGDCSTCPSTCCRSPCAQPCLRPCFPRPCPPRPCSRTCIKPCCAPPRCLSACPSSPSCCKVAPSCLPLIRIIRHNGQYQISTKPSNISNAPSSQFPLKYVLDTSDDDHKPAKYSVEAKFNDYHFDYTSSQTSFVLDFTPPCAAVPPCYKKSVTCMLCQPECAWPPSEVQTRPTEPQPKPYPTKQGEPSPTKQGEPYPTKQGEPPHPSKPGEPPHPSKPGEPHPTQQGQPQPTQVDNQKKA